MSRPPSRRLRALVGLSLVAAGLGLPSVAPAAKSSKLELLAQYEERLVEVALKNRGLEHEPDADGKIVDQIYVDVNPIFLPGDLPLSGKIPWTFLNKFHWTTRPHVVQRELLFHRGDRLRNDILEESGRNLRGLFILAVARLVPVKSPKPGHVSVLVVTKDRWSLRLNTEFVFDQVRLDVLSISLSEGNLLGRNKRLAVEFRLDPGRYGIGASYYDPRVLGSRITLNLLGLAYIGRAASALEGGQVQLALGKPLFSLRTRFGWQASLTYQQDIVRFFKGGEIAQRIFQNPDEPVPDVYRRLNAIASLQATYSLGVVRKLNLSAGWRVQHVRYSLPDDFPEVSDATRSAYQATLPRSESWTGPYVQLEAFSARYLRIRDINTYAITEDFRLGPRLTLEIRASSRYFGFPSDFVELQGTYSHLTYARDNFFDFGANAFTRIQYGVYPGSPFVNQAFGGYLREITPRFGPFRLFIYATLTARAHDLDNQRLTLGSDNGLRGYATRAFQGNNLYRLNVEIRTRALNFWTIHVGGVAFYDGGDAPPAKGPKGEVAGILAGGWHQNAGVGLRILLPQFNREVIRLDLGFPFELPAGGSYLPRFSAEFAQAF